MGRTRASHPVEEDQEQTQQALSFSNQELLKLGLEHPPHLLLLILESSNILSKDFLKVLEAEKEPRIPDHTISEPWG